MSALTESSPVITPHDRCLAAQISRTLHKKQEGCGPEVLVIWHQYRTSVRAFVISKFHPKRCQTSTAFNLRFNYSVLKSSCVIYVEVFVVFDMAVFVIEYFLIVVGLSYFQFFRVLHLLLYVCLPVEAFYLKVTCGY